jgi:predicted nucleic-acid-binding protein
MELTKANMLRKKTNLRSEFPNNVLKNIFQGSKNARIDREQVMIIVKTILQFSKVNIPRNDSDSMATKQQVMHNM